MQPEPVPMLTEKCFREVFCERYQCVPEAFEEKLVWFCIRPETAMLARLCWWVRRKMFATDLEMLRQLGKTTSTRELKYEMESFRHHNPPAGLLRERLKVRVSGQMLLKIAAKLFSAEEARRARLNRNAVYRPSPPTAPPSA